MIRNKKYHEEFVHLLKIIEEQSMFAFTGKINILMGQNNQFIGSIYQLEGKVINASYKSLTGLKSLFNLFYEVSKNSKFKFVAEPEIVEESQIAFDLEANELFGLINKYIQSSKDSEKLKPPGHVKLMISGEFLIHGDRVNSSEFDVLKTVSDFSRVEEIYQNCQLLDYEVTNSLVSLRKKKALKVIT